MQFLQEEVSEIHESNDCVKICVCRISMLITINMYLYEQAKLDFCLSHKKK